MTTTYYIKTTPDTHDIIQQLTTLLHSHQGCKHFHLSTNQVSSTKLDLVLTNNHELVSHVSIGCEYENCKYNYLHIMTTTSPEYQKQNYNQFLTAIVVILAGTLTDNRHHPFTRIADYTTVKARMHVLKKYILYKTNGGDIMTEDEKQFELNSPDGVYNVSIPLFNNIDTDIHSDDDDDMDLVPHENQQIAWTLIHTLVSDNKRGIFCARNASGGKRHKTKHRRRVKHKKTRRSR